MIKIYFEDQYRLKGIHGGVYITDFCVYKFENNKDYEDYQKNQIDDDYLFENYGYGNIVFEERDYILVSKMIIESVDILLNEGGYIFDLTYDKSGGFSLELKNVNGVIQYYSNDFLSFSYKEKKAGIWQKRCKKEISDKEYHKLAEILFNENSVVFTSTVQEWIDAVKDFKVSIPKKFREEILGKQN